MQESKFDLFCKWIGSSFQEVVMETADLDFSYHDDPAAPLSRVVVSIIGMVGKNPGRIIFTAGTETAQLLADRMNGEPLDDPSETYLFLAELTNMVCGHAVTAINNHFPGTQVRLTPPAVIVGANLDIATPNVQSRKIGFAYQHFHVTIDVGFEGV